LKVVRLRDAWATRRLLMATKAGATLSPATQLLVKQLFATSN